MTTATAPAPTAPAPAKPKGVLIKPCRLPFPAAAETYGISVENWRVLVDAIYPNASSMESIILAAAYCRNRNLDIMKRVVHIVPIYSKAQGCYVDTVWPGIAEIRITAHRTHDYAGHDEMVFGPDTTMRLGEVLMTFPEYCQLTVYRLVGGMRCPFPGPRVRWLETYATVKRDSEAPNEMWTNRPYGQLEKCAEAAALRAAFPEELGNEYAAEEVEGRTFNMGSIIDIEKETVPHKTASKVRRSTLNDRDKPTEQAPETTVPDVPEFHDEPLPQQFPETPPDDAGPDEERHPGEDEPMEEAPVGPEQALSPVALAIEEKLHDPNINREGNAHWMQEISAAKLTPDERKHLNAIAQENSRRLKGKK